MTILQATPANINAILSGAAGGDVVECAPGDYGVDLTNFNPGSHIDIKAADPANPPRFVSIELSNAGFLRFSGVIVGRDSVWANAYAMNCFDVEFVGCLLKANAATTGPQMWGPRNKMLNCEITGWQIGFTIGDDVGCVVAGNWTHDNFNDDMRCNLMNGGIIENNYFNSVNLSNHGDHIQAWYSIAGIILRNNIFDHTGGGGWAHCVFWAANATNALIENNFFYVGQQHGISVSGSGIVRNNTVLYMTSGPSTPVISAAGMTLEKNIAHNLLGGDNVQITVADQTTKFDADLEQVAGAFPAGVGSTLSLRQDHIDAIKSGAGLGGVVTPPPPPPPANTPPVVGDDAVLLEQNKLFQVAIADLLANDSDIDGDTVTWAGIVSEPVGVGVVDDGITLTFVPDYGHIGTGTMVYEVSDGTATAQGNVTVDVLAPQPPPPPRQVVSATLLYDDGTSQGI